MKVLPASAAISKPWSFLNSLKKPISLKNAKCLNQTQRPLPHDGFQKLQPGEGPQLVGPQLVGPLMGGPLLPARQQLKEFVACLQTKKCSAERLLQIWVPLEDPKTWHLKKRVSSAKLLGVQLWHRLRLLLPQLHQLPGRMGKVFSTKPELLTAAQTRRALLRLASNGHVISKENKAITIGVHSCQTSSFEYEDEALVNVL